MWCVCVCVLLLLVLYKLKKKDPGMYNNTYIYESLHVKQPVKWKKNKQCCPLLRWNTCPQWIGVFPRNPTYLAYYFRCLFPLHTLFAHFVCISSLINEDLILSHTCTWICSFLTLVRIQKKYTVRIFRLAIYTLFTSNQKNYELEELMMGFGMF